MGFPGGSDCKESTCNAGDLALIPGLGRSPEKEKGYPLQYSALGNSMDCIVHAWGRKELDTIEQLHFHFPLEKGFPGKSVGKESPCNAGDLV